MSANPVVIAACARTPMGAFQGALAPLPVPMLGGVAVRDVLRRARLDPAAVDQIVMGCVLAAGLGQAPARQAGMAAGLPVGVAATTVNKMCGSGMQAAILAHDMILAGSARLVVAGGMESMSNAPYLLARHRSGARIGHDVAIDSMYLDGLEDAYAPGRLMGAFAEDAARAHGIGRAEQDDFALESLNRARRAIADGAFAAEIAPVTVPGRSGDTVVSIDEQPGRARPERIPTLPPAFAPNGTVTAANASSISDGAAALLLCRLDTAERLGLSPLAAITAHAVHAGAPAEFTDVPAPAIEKAVARAGWTMADVDLFEVNEAFAVVAMIAARRLAVGTERLNVNGGACALGHPIGASGARILVTLLAALKARGLKRGVAALCIGGGEATAMAVELL